jgi:hypothetical protein
MHVDMFDSSRLTVNPIRANKSQSNFRRYVVESALQRGETFIAEPVVSVLPVADLKEMHKVNMYIRVLITCATHAHDEPSN